jgi:iron complex outermembrane receptor protein
MRSQSIVGSVLACLIAALVSSVVTADPASPPPANEGSASGSVSQQTNNLDEIVVTARYREERLQDIGMSASVLSGAQISQAGLRDLQDLAAMTPGLDITDRGPNESNVSFRGMATLLSPTNWERNNALVGIYIDDVSVVTPFSNQRSWNLFDMSRVEIVRGPQGTLYGEGAMGGAIRYVTADPSLTEFDGRVAVTGSHYQGSDGNNGREDVTLSIPIIDNEVAVRLTGFNEHDAGFINFTVPGIRDGNDFNSSGGRFVLLALPTEELRERLSVTYEKSELGSEWVVTGNPQDLTNSNNFTLQPQNDSALVVSNRVDYHLSTGTFTSVTGFVDRAREDLGLEPVATFEGVPATKVFLIADRAWSEDLRYVSALSGPLNFSGGVYYKADQQHEPLLETSAAPPLVGSILDENEQYRDKQVGVYGEVRYDLSSQLRATLGARYFRDSVDAFQEWIQPESFYNFIPSSAFQTTLTINKVLPKTLLEYKATDDILVYGGVSEGARNGGLNVTSTVTISTFLGHPLPRVYDPDSALSYEIGVKTDWLDKRLIANADVYYIDWRNLQAQAGSPPIPFGPETISLGYFTNVGNARSVGGEFELDWHPNDRFGATLAGSYTDATINTPFVESTVSGATVPGGARIPFVPKYKLSSSIYEAQNLTDTVRLTEYVDFQYTAPEATSLYSNPPVNPTTPFYQAPGYGQLNLRAAVDVKTWTITTFVNNVTNRIVGVAPGQSTTLTGLNYYVNRPRTVGLTIMDSF